VPPSEDRLQASLARFSSILFTRLQLDEVLGLTASLGRDTIDGATSVSVSLVRDGKFMTPASSDDAAVRIDIVQYEGGDGPCVVAATEGRQVVFRASDQSNRWPRVLDEASKVGVRSAVSFPLIVGEQSIGALNVYSDRADGLPAGGVERGLKFAEAASVVLANAQAFSQRETMAAQLKEALRTRDVIGQAKGILMEREQISGDAAFDLLRKTSQGANVKLRELAERFVAAVEQSAKQKHR
jgi:GAF domain-containing protein